jgi:GTPase SAR1 family protein
MPVPIALVPNRKPVPRHGLRQALLRKTLTFAVSRREVTQGSVYGYGIKGVDPNGNVNAA